MMNIFKKKPLDKPFTEKLAKRVAKIPTADLEMWADQSLYELGRCLSLYGKSRDKNILEEALSGAEALHAVVNELHARTTRM